MLNERDFLNDFGQYHVTRDQLGTWRILDAWHPSLQSQPFDPTTDIPDDSPALTLLSDAAFMAVLKKAAQEGILDKVVRTFQSSEDSEKVEDLEDENDKLKKELGNVKKKDENHSESYLLKRHIVDGMLKLAGMEDLKVVAE